MSAEIDKPTLLQRFVPLFRNFDYVLLLLIGILASVGLLAMYSAGYDHGSRFVDHGRNMLLAAGILFLVSQVPPQRLMLLAVPLYSLGIALLVAVLLFGITKKGAQRWVNVGVVIQPSELLKIATPLMLAWWFQKREGQRRASDFVIAFALLLLPVGLIMKQPDLGTSLLVMAAGLAVIFFAGLPWKLIVPPVVLGVVGIALIIWNEPTLCADGVSWYFLHDYQRTRVCTLLDPTRDPLGKGFMAGTQTHLEFIPERTTDFIFAAYSEEFGLLGNLVLITGFLLLVWRGLAIAMHANTLFTRLMAAAVAMIFFTYAFVNMGMVSGILPVVGVPLPFVSYGGTAMVTLGLALGVLMAVARTHRGAPKDSMQRL
ncbi:MAG: rod shape-determining protein RodA [Acidovorax sp.]|jgi:rod shape determining protein RodA|nr:rod shape-determining protein RodA [Acidovorax sp.]